MNAKKVLLASLFVGMFAAGASTATAAEIIDFDINLDATTNYSGSVENVRRIQFDLNTQTFQYVQDPGNPVQVGDVFYDRGYGDASSYRTSLGGNASQTGPDFLGTTYSMGLIWDELRGVVTGTNTVGGNYVVNANYTSVGTDNFQLFVSAPNTGFGQDYEAAQAHYSAGEQVMELALKSGNSILEFDSAGGDFIEGTFTFEFQVVNVLPGFWFTADGIDFADLLEDEEGAPTFIVSAFASAGTIQEPGPVTFFGDDANNVYGDEREGQSLFSETQSTHDGSLRFAVPEPGTLALMGLSLLILAGFIGVGGMRRRSNSTQRQAA
ncbi:MULTISPECIES: PEP-CTERM sorting domain-containing protein [unclassified Thioalkalivibrio]|uniref:PEP-CTERM sorting domain-containing protein n=1 Tax=unclassified Thioalkalivibrio TaxID=2621013 RepID=UPI0003655738|nr:MULTISPECIES: PEP-CTERM sorting domain-containing protein [unclassified Thioalkalivibrio]